MARHEMPGNWYDKRPRPVGTAERSARPEEIKSNRIYRSSGTVSALFILPGVSCLSKRTFIIRARLLASAD
jgi:hypothetical protein